MAVPANFPLRPASHRRSLRVYLAGTTTNDFAATGILFKDPLHPDWDPRDPMPNVAIGDRTAVVQVGTNLTPGSPMGGGTPAYPNPVAPGTPASAVPVPMAYAGSIAITNNGASPIEFSFDGTNVHGIVPAGARREYRDRFEAGVALRSAAPSAFVVEAW